MKKERIILILIILNVTLIFTTGVLLYNLNKKINEKVAQEPINTVTNNQNTPPKSETPAPLNNESNKEDPIIKYAKEMEERYSELGYNQIIKFDSKNPKYYTYTENIHNIEVSFLATNKYAIEKNMPTVKQFQGSCSSGIKIGLNSGDVSTLPGEFTETELEDFIDNMEYVHVGMDTFSYSESDTREYSAGATKEDFVTNQGIKGTLITDIANEKVTMVLNLGNTLHVGYVTASKTTYDNQKNEIIDILKSIKLLNPSDYE